ncbi:MAG: 30S ribosome-binding factor RbfA [Verrucomicrobiae bacterium]|nr:30S ribosome-binding factor RbfA [Verrucomicrobiae bacterium]
MSRYRMQRVCQLVKEQIGEILERHSFTDCGFITVTDAAISPDLKEGRIYVSVIGTDQQQQRALAELQARHIEIQRELASRIVLKYTPRLTFTLDHTGSRAARIEHLLDELNRPPNE